MFQFGLFYSFEVWASKHTKSILIIIMSLCPCIDLKSTNIIGGGQEGEKKAKEVNPSKFSLNSERWRKMQL